MLDSDENTTVNCPICCSESFWTHKSIFLSKYSADYFKCKNCEFWFVLDPHWIDEAYTDAITLIDTGLVYRNLKVARKIKYVLNAFSLRGQKCVDWAGGTGLLTRLMRDSGYDYLWSDSYAENIHARGFEYRSGSSTNFVSLIEVLEHLVDPYKDLDEIVKETKCDMIVFTQVLHINSNDPNWWYFMPETGQHISFYSEKTLKQLANLLEFKFYNFGDLFVFTKHSPMPFRGLLWRAISIIDLSFERLFFRKKQIWKDHLKLKAMIRPDQD